MQLYLNLLVFIFGLVVGSFLNCVIYRLEKKQSFLKGRSFCPKCRHILGFWDLMPVLSFVFLRGKCRYCGKKISIQYPLVEIGTAVLFLLIFNFYFFPVAVAFGDATGQAIFNVLNLLLLFVISFLLIVVFIYDLKHYVIPDKVVFPAIGAAVLFLILKSLIFNLKSSWPFLGAALGASCFFFAIWLLSKGRAMGFGDVKLVFLLGLLLGWPNILVGLFIAFLSGALIGLLLIALKKKGLKSQVPFGPFLIFGAFVALLWGSQLWKWYLNIVQ